MMNKHASSLSIKSLILASFVLLIVISLAQAGLSYFSNRALALELNNFSQVQYPIAYQALSIDKQLSEYTTQLGFALVNSSDVERQNISKKMQRLEKNIEQFSILMQASIDIDDKSDVATLLQQLQAEVVLLSQQSQVLITQLADSDNVYPAKAGFKQNLAPLALKIEFLYNDMNELLLDVESDNQQQLIDMSFSSFKQLSLFLKLHRNTQSFLSYRDSKYLDEVALFEVELKREIASFLDTYEEVDEDISDSMMEVEELFGEYNAELERLMVLHLSPKWRMDAYLVKTQIQPVTIKVNQLLAQIVNLIDKRLALSAAQADKKQQHLQRLIIATMLVAFAVAVVMALWINLILKDWLDLAKQAFSAFKQGLLFTRLPPSKVKENNDFASAFNQHAQSLSNIIEQAQITVSKVRQGSQELKQSSVLSSGNCAQQLEHAQGAKADIGEISRFASKMSEQSAQTAQITQHTKVSLDLGMSSVTQLAQEVEALDDEVCQTTQEIESLAAASYKINQVTDVINSLAENTSLLALNAAIEAARAGEQGRSFSVVADEVRSLAVSTQTATGQITDNVAHVIAAIDSAKQSMLKNKHKVQACVQQVDLANQGLASIGDQVDGVVASSRIISDMAATQKNKSLSSQRNVDTIKSEAELTQENTRQIEALSDDLDQVSQELCQNLDFFKIKAG